MNDFQDMLPVMADKLGGEGLIEEMCKGFSVLMDREKGVITYESLKKNSSCVLGLQDLRDDELQSMLKEGDLNGDGALDQMEFCVLIYENGSDEICQDEYFNINMEEPMVYDIASAQGREGDILNEPMSVENVLHQDTISITFAPTANLQTSSLDLDVAFDHCEPLAIDDTYYLLSESARDAKAQKLNEQQSSKSPILI
ncbi:hypothetical protein BUALT_Bualt18G0034600 [Buddleja alternifolia]|uniref:EF-hand domain-containing protein n=1 Tax=Buddleja alternifolia TaxID=168488 RepID=A0AAV6W8A9_9LAMI|nr:hypothetical protein BUALT_Bualt18G0034600 [Buddleja alternifolia]